MALLDPTADTSPPVDTAPPAADPVTPPVDTATPPADPMADAASKLFGENPDGQPRNDAPPADETPEQKAEREAREAETPEQKEAREAREREGETPEQKEARERAELDAKRYGAPEGDYEAFTLPDGVELDTESTTELAAAAKELNLSQASVQKIVDIAATKAARDVAAAQASLDAVHDKWVADAKGDKEFGGDKLNATLAEAQRAVKQFGDPELTELLVGARLGDHPAIIRFAARAGRALGEAPIVNGGRPASGSAESVLYPNLKQ